ncbi:MAG: cytochrome c biogenesis protein ResB [Clostridia bacterium]|nr:cytochrome c biogenesis protein ResB [Clostridia bacterium]
MTNNPNKNNNSPQIEESHSEESHSEKNISNEIWQFFSSMKVGLILLLILTAVSIYAATFLEHQPAMEKVYSSWWFIGLLGITGLNLLVCSINRFPKLWKQVSNIKSNVDLTYLKSLNKQTILPYKAAPEKAGHLENSLKKKGYRTRAEVKDGGFLISADKGRFGYLGSLVTHVSLILILLAGLAGILGGFSDFQSGFPGEIIHLHDQGFDVRIDDFEIKYRDDAHRTIEQYYSTLTVIDIENDSEIKQETIYVNRPLRYKGVNFYQSTYGWGVDVEFHNPATDERKTMLLVPGQSGFYEDLGIHISILRFFPDFTMTRDGTPITRTQYPANPMVAFQIFNRDGQLIGQQYYIEPFNQVMGLFHGHTMEFTDYKNYTGFQIIKQPGKPLALAASILLTLGLIMSFYMYPRRVWLYSGQDTKGQIIFAGTSRRNKVGFELEFEKLYKELSKIGEDK